MQVCTCQPYVYLCVSITSTYAERRQYTISFVSRLLCLGDCEGGIEWLIPCRLYVTTTNIGDTEGVHPLYEVDLPICQLQRGVTETNFGLCVRGHDQSVRFTTCNTFNSLPLHPFVSKVTLCQMLVSNYPKAPRQAATDVWTPIMDTGSHYIIPKMGRQINGGCTVFASEVRTCGEGSVKGDNGYDFCPKFTLLGPFTL